jgi:hypothetical protein
VVAVGHCPGERTFGLRHHVLQVGPVRVLRLERGGEAQRDHEWEDSNLSHVA